MKNLQLNLTQNSVPSGSRGKVAALLNQELANLGDLYSQTKQAHWNVRGKKFGDLGTADLFTEISRGLDKSLWMLEASK
jgi:starvation-inducible DNA-binding protein